MINFDYELWKDVCSNIKDYAKVYGKFYIQLYPFTFSTFYDHISLDFFYNNFIKNGGIFEINNFEFPENYAIKNDGTIRKRYLLTPIIYLYYVAMGKYISTKFKSRCIADNYFSYYAGNFEKNEYHYKNSYNRYISKVKSCAENYNYYLKLDITSFFDNIDLKKLKKILIYSNTLTETEANVFETILSICGNGKMPQTECGITSSYLSTICYMDLLDKKLLDYLAKYNCFSKFAIVRYVDDFFIFFTTNTSASSVKIENDITNYLNNIYHEYGLCINKSKTVLKKSKKIYEDIKSFSLFDDIGIDEDLDNFFSKNVILTFLNNLINCVNKEGVNYKEYNKIINKIFNSKKTRYHASQIYYALIYKKSKWLSQIDTKNAIRHALENDYNILVHDPKPLTTMIVKTEDELLIKKLLDKLFRIYRSGEWNIACTYISLIYLFNSGFKHIDLLNIIKIEDSLLYNYINNYCKSSWYYRVSSINNRKFVTKAYLRKSNLYYLLLMYIFELKNINYLHAYSYFKNYFDVLTAHLAHTIDSSKKFSVESYYKEKDLKKFYQYHLPEMTDKIENTINDTAKYRNGDPVCHGSGKMLDYVNQTELLLKNINDLQIIIDAYIGNLL